jgi:antitoxin ParD1/3/4
LRDWQLRRALHQKDLEELRRLWKEGTDSGPGPLADMQAIKAEARRRFEQTAASE